MNKLINKSDKTTNAFKHGMSNSRIYRTWADMIKRCTDIKTSNHMGRGIEVCYRWSNKNPKGFENFYRDVGDPPKGLTLDRINNNGNYEPNNWRWATPKQQARNTSQNIFLTYNNETKLMILFSEEYKIPYGTLWARIYVYGWSPEKALTTPIRKTRPLEIRNYERLFNNDFKNLRSKSNSKIKFSKYLPYNSEQLHGHLENIKSLQNNSCPMCHKSYNEIKYDVDHITPTSTAKTKEELLKLFDLKNLSLLCWYCNRHIKRDKISK